MGLAHSVNSQLEHMIPSDYSPVNAINEVNCIRVVSNNTYNVMTVDPGGLKEGWGFEPRLETFIRLNNFLNTINDLINAHFQMDAPYLMPPPPPTLSKLY